MTVDREQVRRDAKHYGSLRGLPPYVGGDDDEITSWQADCDCGWRGRETPYQSVASGDLVTHLNGALRSTRAELEQAERERDRAEKERDMARNSNHRLVRINGGLRGKASDEPDDHWCAVEGCQNEPTMYEFASDEFVCDEHVYYGAENPLAADLRAAEAQLAAVRALVEALRREHPGHGPTGHAPWVRDCDTCAALSRWEQAQGEKP